MSGKLSLEGDERVTWEVPDFFKLPTLSDYFIESPQFRFNSDLHCLRLYPNFWEVKNFKLNLCVAFELLRFPSYVSEINVMYKIGYKSITGKEVETEKGLLILVPRKLLFTASRSVFEKEKDTYVPEGILTVFCRMRVGKSSGARGLQPEVGETSVDQTLVSQQDGEQGGLPSVDKLQPENKQLLQNEVESDACFVVSGKEFQVHRNILRASSPVFDAMFDEVTAKNGSVVIDDLDPDSFRVFLEYVYTGSVEGFSNDNVFELYMAADRFQMPTLKSECVVNMRKNLSVDSFCDVMTLALRHNEMDLMEQTVEFFKRNLFPIVLTLKWQQFMCENCTTAHELLIKGFHDS